MESSHHRLLYPAPRLHPYPANLPLLKGSAPCRGCRDIRLGSCRTRDERRRSDHLQLHRGRTAAFSPFVFGWLSTSLLGAPACREKLDSDCSNRCKSSSEQNIRVFETRS